jgi:hypothetical protein
MSDEISELATALRERRMIVGDQESRRDAASHLRRLQAVSEKIEQFEAKLTPQIPAQLAHYLERRSYDKALEYIETQL